MNQLMRQKLFITTSSRRPKGALVSNMLRMDRLDSELISQLERDARQGIGELAERLGVSRNTVQSRLRRLTEAGLLQGFSPRLDLAAAGISVEAFAALALEQGRLDETVQQLSEMPEVMEIHTTTGREDLLVRLGAVSHAELQESVQRILALPAVGHSNTALSLTTPLAYRVAPLLAKVTADSGWGRSTALPEQYRAD